MSALSFSGKVMVDRHGMIAPSALSTLAACPRAYAITRDLKKARGIHKDIREDKKNYKTFFGSFFHHIVETNMSQCDIDDYIYKEVLEKDDDFWDDKYRGADDLIVALKKAQEVFYSSDLSDAWVEDREKSKFEIRMECEIEGLRAVGYVDLIDSEGVITDLKTTSAYSRAWHGTQLAVYYLMARKLQYNPAPDARIVKVIRPLRPNNNVKVSEEWINVSMLEEHALKLIREAKELYDRREGWQDDYTYIFANPNGGRCGFCVARGTSACPETRGS